MTSPELPEGLYDDLVKEFGAVKSVTRQVLALLLECGLAQLRVQDAAILVPRSNDSLGFLQSTNPKLTQLDLPPIPITASIAGFVFVSAQTMSFDRAAEAAEFFDAIDKAAGYSTKEYLAAPVVSGDATVGVMTFVNRTGGAGPFTKTDIDMASRLAAVCGILMEHIGRSRQLVDATLDQLKATFESSRAAAGAAARFPAGQHRNIKAEIVEALEPLEARELELIKNLINSLGGSDSELVL